MDQGADFEAWKAQWTSYSTLSELEDQSAATKVQVLSLCLMQESLAVVNNLGLTDEQKQDATAIIAVIECHIDVQVMQGEEFHISVIANVQPLCVHTPQTIPFACCDRLKAELDLLQ